MPSHKQHQLVLSYSMGHLRDICQELNTLLDSPWVALLIGKAHLYCMSRGKKWSHFWCGWIHSYHGLRCQSIRIGSPLGCRVNSGFLRHVPVLLMLETRQVLEYERRYAPCNYNNCGSLLIGSTDIHILSLSLSLLEGDVWDICDGHQHQHTD